VPSTAPPAPAADPQRIQDLQAYAAAYRATARNGFYTVKIPVISLALKDPATGSTYAVTKNAPAAPGQIRYWIGGACVGAAHVPGSAASKYLAVQIFLEGSAAPHCIQVN
jgi:hypothetical protein